MRTSRSAQKTGMRPSRSPRKTEIIENNSLLSLLRSFSKTSTGEHLSYILLCFRYLVITLLVGFCIQYCWNFASDRWFDGVYHMSLFEAAILWVCIY